MIAGRHLGSDWRPVSASRVIARTHDVSCIYSIDLRTGTSNMLRTDRSFLFGLDGYGSVTKRKIILWLVYQTDGIKRHRVRFAYRE